MSPLLAEAQVIESEKNEPLSRRYDTAKLGPETEIDGQVWPDKGAFRLLLSSLILFLLVAISFGGVHKATYEFSVAAVSVLTALTLWSWPIYKIPSISEVYRNHKSGAIFVGALGAFAIYLVLQYLIYGLISESHPVLGRANPWIDRINFWPGLLSIFTALGMFLCFRIGVLRSATSFVSDDLANHAEPVPQLSRLVAQMVWLSVALSVVAVVVALISLTHWFTDNGKLFWIFAPENIFIPLRARWPFVNPNHLAHFLVPLLFVTLIPCGIALDVLVRKLAEPGRRGVRMTRSMQRWIALLVGACTALGITAVAVVAAQSRGAFIALGFGALALLLSSAVSSIARERAVKLVAPVLGRPISPFGKRISSAQEHERRWQNFNLRMIKILRRIAPAVLLVIGVLFVGMFIRDQGATRLEDRMQYGLIHALDDSRWQMYSDTIAILRHGPWFVIPFGVGFGNWLQIYLRGMDSSLAGIDPVYLHSDPLQLLAEVGVVGAAIPIALAIALIVFGYQAISSISKSVLTDLNTGSQPPSATALRSALTRLEILYIGRCLFSALVAAIFCSIMDFPFRIPAFMLLVVILTALYTTVVDALLPNKSPTN